MWLKDVPASKGSIQRTKWKFLMAFAIKRWTNSLKCTLLLIGSFYCTPAFRSKRAWLVLMLLWFGKCLHMLGKIFSYEVWNSFITSTKRTI